MDGIHVEKDFNLVVINTNILPANAKKERQKIMVKDCSLLSMA